MNRRPVSYLQTDPRWGALSYSAPGEHSTIGKAGCGPACAAMLLATLTGREITPATTCEWAVAHGYKAPHQGTYHSYFVPQFKAYAVACRQLTAGAIYGQPNAPAHGEAMALLRAGWYLIALMGPGRWTRGGHYIVVWWADDAIRIHDPASTLAQRVTGDPKLFFEQVKHYWAVDARAYNTAEDDDMTDEVFAEKMNAYLNALAAKGPAPWSAQAWQTMERAGLFRGDETGELNGQTLVTRDVLAVVLHRLLAQLHALPTEETAP